MLLAYGTVTVKPEWKVTEVTPPGYCRLYYVYSGEVVYTDEKIQKKYLKPDRVYVFPSSAKYQMRHNPQNPLFCTFLHIDILPYILNDIIELEIKENSLLKYLLQSIECAISEQNQQIIEVLAEALRLYLIDNKYFQKPKIEIYKILNYISDNIQRSIRLEELSKMCGYNSQYFIRLFKSSIGLTPYQYIINCRMKKAVQLLKQNTPITYIAEQTGYKDIKAFSRAFKMYFKVPPSEYLRKNIILP
ncbi:MAG TPA: helix-turn-helix transcriptional regulator [Clostridiaceae bacterium]|nr:helix-turn-helix transcriptional regulator [Clostridiaceae bacterium]